VAATGYRMLYLGGYKALCPTPGFPSAGTPSSLFSIFHTQAWCLLRLASFVIFTEPISFVMFAKAAIFILALAVFANASPYPGTSHPHSIISPAHISHRTHSSGWQGWQGWRYIQSAFDHFVLLTSIAGSKPLVNRPGQQSLKRWLDEGTRESHPLPTISPAHVNHRARSSCSEQ